MLIRTIIIDDELLSIQYLATIFKELDFVKVVGKYTNSVTALDEMEKLNPDVIFLDIHMPEISGIELSIKAKEILPKSNIIFVTAHEHYALKAFEIGVTDFIEKPINKNRVQQVMEKVSQKIDCSHKQDEYYVCSFKHFHFKKNGQIIQDVKWRTAKVRELFIYLLQNYKESVHKDVLIELLWPNLKLKNAYENLYSAIYYIRKTLKNIGVNIEIISTENCYKLRLNNVKYDVDEWEKGIKLEKVSEKNYKNCEEMMELYTGNYLEGDTYVWKENEQERLRVMYIAKTKFIIDYLIKQKNYTQATLHALHLQKVYPYIDYSYFKLMKLYDYQNDMYNEEAQYNKLKNMLINEFDTLPHESIRKWYQRWIKNQLIM